MTSILDLPAGLHDGFPDASYHARHLGLASKHALDLVARSPAHYKAWLDGADESDTDALRFGRAFDCALLEPTRFANSYSIEPEVPDFGNMRTKEARANRDAWRARMSEFFEGREIISREDFDSVGAMARAINAHPVAAPMLRGGRAQVTLRWDDAETGVPCKARADYVVPELCMVVDVKTAIDASREGFRRAVARFRYHVQDATYRAGFDALGMPVSHFVFLVVEKTPPYAVALYQLDHDGVRKGYQAFRNGLATLAECCARNEFPGYPQSIQTLDLPPWSA